MSRRVHGLLLAALLTSACLRPSEERAERDLEVGRATAGGVRVQVRDGLAAVRSLGPGELVLWASAPALRVDITRAADSPATFELEVRNALPDLELRVTAQGARIEPLAQPVPTHKRWRVTSDAGEAGASLGLALEPPDAAERAPFRVAVLSDVQEAIDRLPDIHRKLNAEPGVRFLLGAGDLTERGTRQQLELYQRLLRELHIPYYTTLGNHELGEQPTLWHEYFGRGSFHFSFRGVEFSCIDSASATVDPLVYDWLDGWLARGRERVHVVSMHIPPIDPIGVRNGSFASRNEAAKLLTRLARGRVDLTVYGHIHSFYSFENAGIPAYISGGGGAIPERFDGIGRHFIVIELGADHGLGEVRVVRVD